MKSIQFIFLFLFLLKVQAADGQSQKAENPYVKLGQKALIDGNFRSAVAHLEKSLPSESNNSNVLYMLAYSYYHSGDFQKSISTFGQVISLRPGEVSAYYYRGKARNVLATRLNSPLSSTEREKLLLASVRDYSTAISLNGADLKLYQNRAIAYRDHGILKSQKIPKFYDKAAAASSFKSSIADLQHVLELSPARKDITDELKKVKVYLSNLNNK